MHGLHLAKARIARKRRQDAQAQLVEQRRDMKELTGDVVLADQIDVVHLDAGSLRGLRYDIRLAPADDILEHRLAAEAIAEILGTVKASRVDRYNRHAVTLCCRFADGFKVVADQGGDAGRIDEHGRRRIVVDCLLDGMK